MLAPAEPEELDLSALLAQSIVDRPRLVGNLRDLVPERSAATLSDIVAVYPIEQGAAEIVDRLNGDESALYADLVGDRYGPAVRLEQERLDWGWVLDNLLYG